MNVIKEKQVNKDDGAENKEEEENNASETGNSLSQESAMLGNSSLLCDTLSSHLVGYKPTSVHSTHAISTSLASSPALSSCGLVSGSPASWTLASRPPSSNVPSSITEYSSSGGIDSNFDPIPLATLGPPSLGPSKSMSFLTTQSISLVPPSTCSSVSIAPIVSDTLQQANLTLTSNKSVSICSSAPATVHSTLTNPVLDAFVTSMLTNSKP
ncbi:unnamed protein product [Protopolystoma xenopodis]|uniref:Uncharacterized protein n=1 Tax=Protopolystoma xenopodis TaxID=117903 RepID=A0A3S4ZT33_9PLAT|nr:unnamed protein product [Protopolystoma xenopodis]